jgi:methylated-DNA-[protein]-cysteine S-methyltransferase
MARKSVETANAEKFTRYIETPVGRLQLVSDGKEILSVHFIKHPATESEENSECQPACLVDCETQLREYFEGKRKIFDLPISARGTEFQEKVWRQLQAIPYGVTISYQQLAKWLGNPKLIRAAGSANGKNPIAIIIPCHRVIGSSGELVGYAGGLPLKKWLLDHEKKQHTGVFQVSLFGNDLSP